MRLAANQRSTPYEGAPYEGERYLITTPTTPRHRPPLALAPPGLLVPPPPHAPLQASGHGSPTTRFRPRILREPALRATVTLTRTNHAARARALTGSSPPHRLIAHTHTRGSEPPELFFDSTKGISDVKDGVGSYLINPAVLATIFSLASHASAPVAARVANLAATDASPPPSPPPPPTPTAALAEPVADALADAAHAHTFAEADADVADADADTTAPLPSLTHHSHSLPSTPTPSPTPSPMPSPTPSPTPPMPTPSPTPTPTPTPSRRHADAPSASPLPHAF